MHRITPIILDIESSGFGPCSYPIEVGIALASGQRLSMLVRPQRDWTHWNDSAENLHGISRMTLLAHGRSAYEVAATLNSRLQGKQVYSDGWVVDKPWLSRLFHAGGIAMQFQLSPIEQLLSEAQMLCWDTIKQQVLAEHREKRHRASYDAWIIQQTWLRSRLQNTG